MDAAVEQHPFALHPPLQCAPSLFTETTRSPRPLSPPFPFSPWGLGSPSYAVRLWIVVNQAGYKPTEEIRYGAVNGLRRASWWEPQHIRGEMVGVRSKSHCHLVETSGRIQRRGKSSGHFCICLTFQMHLSRQAMAETA